MSQRNGPHGPGPAGPDSPDGVGVGDILRENLTDRNSLIDSTLPTLAFLGGYLLTGSQLRPALVAALVAGGVIALLRVLRRESLRHIAAGFFGVAIAAWLANQTGRAEDFFLPGLLLNLGYAAAFVVSALIRRPLVGVGIQVMTQDRGSWAQFAPLRRAAYRATWLWGALFGLRVAVQLPLYLAGAVGALGGAKLALGFPLFLLGAFATHRLLSPALALRREAEPVGGSHPPMGASDEDGLGPGDDGAPRQQAHGHEAGPDRDPLGG